MSTNICEVAPNMMGGGVRTWRFCARTVVIFVIPRTKHIASRILDLPEPLSPVMELKLSSLRRRGFSAPGSSIGTDRRSIPSSDDGSHGV